MHALHACTCTALVLVPSTDYLVRTLWLVLCTIISRFSTDELFSFSFFSSILVPVLVITLTIMPQLMRRNSACVNPPIHRYVLYALCATKARTLPRFLLCLHSLHRTLKRLHVLYRCTGTRTYFVHEHKTHTQQLQICHIATKL